MKRTTKLCLLSSASLMTLMGVAAAQGAPATPGTARAGKNQIEEVIVTAEKRSQKIMEVPSSIQAFSGKSLKASGVTDTAGLAQVTPGLTFTKSSQGAPVYTLRGLGFDTPSFTATSPVGIYVDEVAYAYPYMSSGPLFDVSRVEVLKGPQGTLYGRNTTAGLINFITAQPTQRLTGGITAELGNYGTHNFEGYLSGPITNTLSIRVAGRLERSDDGWQHSISSSNTLGRKNDGGARITVDWKPTSDFSANLMASYWYNKSDTVAPQAVRYVPQTPPFVLPGLASAVRQNWTSTTADWGPQYPGQPGFVTDSSFFALAGRLNYRVNDHLTLTSLTGYNHLDRNDNNDLDGTKYDVFSSNSYGHISSLSQELRAVGDFGALKYIFGAYYSHDTFAEDSVGVYDGSSTNHVLRFLAQDVIDPLNQRYSAAQYAQGFALYRDLMNGTSTSKSVFVNLDYPITDQFKIGGGLRYTTDSLHFGSCSADYNGNTLPIWNTTVEYLVLGTTTPSYLVKRNGCMTFNETFTGPSEFERPALNQDNVSGRVTAEYSPTKDALLYTTISRGFKSGAAPVLNANEVVQLTPAQQEEVLAYEVGSKLSLFSRQLQITGALFYDNYKNKQLYGSVADPVFTALPKLVNVPRSIVDGGELNITWRATDNFTFNFGTAYTNSDVTDYIGINRFGKSQDFQGSQFPNTPLWQTTGSVIYSQEVFNDYELSFNLNVNSHSGATGALGDEKGFQINGYTLTNADLSLTSLKYGWRVDFWGKNIFNTYYWTSTDIFTDTVIRIPGMAATYGASLSYTF